MDAASIPLTPNSRAPSARWKRWLVRIAVGLAALAGLAYAGAVATMWAKQDKLLFWPDVLPADHRFKVDSDVSEVFVDVPGAKLHALHMRLPNPRGVVFYLHGNTGSLDRWFVGTELFRKANFDLFMLDYRGYGKSSGRIDGEAQLHADVRAAWQSIASAYEGKQRVVYGRSLGSAPAAQLAADVRPDLTVLVSPYQSMKQIVAELHPWVPSFALRYPLRTDEAVSRIKTPLMIVHGELDTLIKPVHAKTLASLAPGTQLVLVPDADHGNILDTTGYISALSARLTQP